MRVALTSMVLLLLSSACRIESAAPQSSPAPAASDTATGDVWVYTSMYRHVIDTMEPKLKSDLPGITVHWFQAGSEKVLSRLEAELAAGGTQADVLLTSDPFLYQRYATEGRFLRYVSPNALRTPKSLVDLDGRYTAARLSTMVLVHRTGLPQPPTAFADLTAPRFKSAVALGDPLTSGTAFTWAVFMANAKGADWFSQLRANQAVVAGGNAAVLQKLEGGEAQVGVLLLENALAAKQRGSPVEIVWPSDGAVVIPGDVAIFSSTRHGAAAKAVVDWLLSPTGQQLIVAPGDMNAIDPRLGGPRDQPALDDLMKRSQPWSETVLDADGAKVKASFSQAFSK